MLCKFQVCIQLNMSACIAAVLSTMNTAIHTYIQGMHFFLLLCGLNTMHYSEFTLNLFTINANVYHCNNKLNS